MESIRSAVSLEGLFTSAPTRLSKQLIFDILPHGGHVHFDRPMCSSASPLKAGCCSEGFHDVVSVDSERFRGLLLVHTS